MFLNSLILILSYFSILGFGFFANKFFCFKSENLSKIFILGFIFQSIILQVHYIFFQ